MTKNKYIEKKLYIPEKEPQFDGINLAEMFVNIS